VHAACLEIAADASCLDVHDAARAHRDRVLCPARRSDRLVEADRRRDDLRQRGMPAQVLLRQRLLDQQQAELVQLRKPVGIAARVGRVRIDLEENVSEPFADRLDVLPGLDLQLDPAVTLFEVALDGAEKIVHALVDADRHTAVDLGPDATEVLAERDTLSAQLGVEDRHLERSLRHRVAAHTAQRRADVLGGYVAAREQSRQQMPANHILGAVDVLVRVERVAERHALAPAFGGGADHTHEQDVALALGAE
jgi:hypothetical protein